MPERIRSKKVKIDSAEVARFFRDRADRSSMLDPVVLMLYQDKDPALAKTRDLHEKETFLRILAPQRGDRVLDLGCGVGRWATAFVGKVERYVGVDPSEPLIEMAREAYGQIQGFSFLVSAAEDENLRSIDEAGQFSIIIVAGVLHYLNDDALILALKNVAAMAAPLSRILIRTPIGSQERLTLDGVWSEELQHSYSAIYRSHDEYLAFLDEYLVKEGFCISDDARLFPDNLNNRADTHQHYFLLSRKASASERTS